MSLDHAILGFLKDRPRSGYDLKTVFDMTVRHFWPADQSQIYRTLASLAEKGWIKTEVIRQNRLLDTKIYHITPEGSDELLRWLRTPLPPKPMRLPKLIQIFFGAKLTNDEAIQCFERFTDYHRRALAELRRLPERGQAYKSKNPPLSAKDYYFRMLTFECGMRLTETCLAWGEDVIARLRRGDHLKGGHNEDTRNKRKPTRRTREHAGSDPGVHRGGKRGRSRG
jgi:PadR family transcriptional regulator, regulatory protein AphA